MESAEIIFSVKECKEEGGFIAEAMGHGIVTQGESWEELKEMIVDAIQCHFDDKKQRTALLRLVKEEIIAA